MIKTYSFVHAVTGEVHPQRFTTDAAGPMLATSLKNNTPLSHVAVEGELVYQPPQPSPDHAWDAGAGRWALDPVVAASQDRRKSILARILELETRQPRVLREAVLDVDGAKQRLQQIETAIVELRRQLQ